MVISELVFTAVSDVVGLAGGQMQGVRKEWSSRTLARELPAEHDPGTMQRCLLGAASRGRGDYSLKLKGLYDSYLCFLNLQAV